MDQPQKIRISLNEHPAEVFRGSTAGDVRKRVKAGADLVIVNGFPAEPGLVLREGDHVVLIQRGETPSREELEGLMAARHTPGVHERMKAAAVGIAGLGGLGSIVATALARLGVGTLVLADFDLVEPSNLNRQQYSVRHIGTKKVDAMAEQLAAVNPYVHVAAHDVILTAENIPLVFENVQVLVECLDRAEAKAMLLAAASDLLPDAYIIGASGVAGYGASNEIRTERLGERIFMVGDMISAAEPGRGLMAPRVGIAAHHQANLVVSLLMGEAYELVPTH